MDLRESVEEADGTEALNQIQTEVWMSSSKHMLSTVLHYSGLGVWFEDGLKTDSLSDSHEILDPTCSSWLRLRPILHFWVKLLQSTGLQGVSKLYGC